MKTSGIKTAINDALIESTVKRISAEPSIAACSGGAPPSIWRKTFSTSTMASSTTKPMAIVSAISERLSRVKPSVCMTANAPKSDNTIVKAGTRVAQT